MTILGIKSSSCYALLIIFISFLFTFDVSFTYTFATNKYFQKVELRRPAKFQYLIRSHLHSEFGHPQFCICMVKIINCRRRRFGWEIVSLLVRITSSSNNHVMSSYELYIYLSLVDYIEIVYFIID